MVKPISSSFASRLCWTVSRWLKMLQLLLQIFLLTSVIGRPVPKGVPIHGPGELRITVDGSRILVTVKDEQKCTGKFEMWYPVKSVLDDYAVPNHSDLCTLNRDARILRESPTANTACPLKKSGADSITVDVKALPSGCSVFLTNAEYLSSTEKNKVADSRVWLVVVIVLAVTLPLCICTGVMALIWWCKKRRTAGAMKRVRPPTHPALDEKESVVKAPKSRSTPVPTKPNAPPKTLSSKPNSKPAGAVVPAPTPTKAVLPTHPPTPTPTPAPAVPAAHSTMEDVDFDFGPPKDKEAKKEKTVNRDPIARGPIKETFAQMRSSGSVLTARAPKSKQKNDSIGLKAALVETAVKSMVRHGCLDALKHDAMVCSLRDGEDEPLDFGPLKRRYADVEGRVTDPREIELVSTPLANVIMRLEQFSEEARRSLVQAGVEIPLDGLRAQFSERARALVAASSTPTHVMLVALGLEFGYLVPTQGEETMERRFANYAAQLLLVVAMRREFSETERHEAAAFFVRRVYNTTLTYDDVDLGRMAFPLNLVPQGKRLCPAFYRDRALCHAFPSTPQDPKPEACCQKGKDVPKTNTDAASTIGAKDSKEAARKSDRETTETENKKSAA